MKVNKQQAKKCISITSKPKKLKLTKLNVVLSEVELSGMKRVKNVLNIFSN